MAEEGEGDVEDSDDEEEEEASAAIRKALDGEEEGVKILNLKKGVEEEEEASVEGPTPTTPTPTPSINLLYTLLLLPHLIFFCCTSSPPTLSLQSAVSPRLFYFLRDIYL